VPDGVELAYDGMQVEVAPREEQVSTG
jgi:hypothetical protein